MKALFIVFSSCIVFAGCHGNEPIKTSQDTQLVRKAEAPENVIDEASYIDAVLTSAMANAVSYAADHLGNGPYTHEILTPMITGDTVRSLLSFGQLYEEGSTHLYVKSSGAFTTPLLAHVYLLREGSFRLVAADTIALNTFVSDSIGDVNGDQLKDYRFVTYAMSGCCARDYCKLYRYDSATGGFGQPYYFMNAAFFPDKKEILGVGYGHPQEVGLYKLQWNDTLVEPVEYIYHDYQNEKRFIRTKKEKYQPTVTDGDVLTEVPQDYLGIPGYTWFIYEEK